MARAVPIGEYQSEVPVQEGLRRVVPEVRPSQIGPALSDVGESLAKVQQSDAASYTLNALSKAQAQWHQHLQDSMQSAAPGAPGFTKQISDDYGKFVDDQVKNAPRGPAQRYLQSHLTELGGQLTQTAMLFEAKQRQDNNINIAAKSVDDAGNELMNNPGVFGERLAQRRELINGLNMDPDIKQKLQDHATQTLAKFATMGDIEKDPYGAMKDLASATPQKLYTQALTPELKQQMLDHADRMLHQRVADGERLEQMQAKDQEKAAESIMSQGLTMSTQGKLTTAWVVANHALLKPSQYEFMLNQTNEGGADKIKTDVPTYAGLLTRMSNGEDVRDDTNTALTRSLLSKEDYTRLIDGSAKEQPGWYKRGHDYIQTAGQVSQLEPDPAKAQTLANMQNDWVDWSHDNPKATPQDAEKEFRGIVARYQLVKADQNTLTLPVPRYFQGTRAAPDIAASKNATVNALKAGEINQDDFNRQAALLAQWQHANDALQQRKAAAAAAAKKD
jgi:hypothetical protein